MADRTDDKPAGIKPAPAAKAAPAASVKSLAAAPVAPAKVNGPKPAATAARPPVAAPKAATPAPAAAGATPPAPIAKPAPLPPARAVVPAPEPVAPVPAPPVTQPLTEGNPAMATNSFTPPNFTTFMPTPENMQSMFGDLQGRAKAQMERGAKLVEDMGEFAKGNVEAVMTSGRVAVRGAETIGQDAAEYSKRSFESAAAAFKAMVAAKSPTELFTLQSDYARKSFDTAVAEGSKFSEAWLKLAGDMVQPLSTRVAMAAEKLKVAAS